MKTSTVIVLIGQAGSGKGTVAQYLEAKYALKPIMYSQAFRDVLYRLGIENTRAHLSAVSNAFRELFGQDVLGRAVSAEIDRKQAPLVLVEWARRIGDLAPLRENHHVKILYVDASQHIRYERVILRGQNADDSYKTLVQFQADDLGETESAIRDFKSEAWQIIDNDGSLLALHDQVDRVMQTLLTE